MHAKKKKATEEELFDCAGAVAAGMAGIVRKQVPVGEMPPLFGLAGEEMTCKVSYGM